MLTLRPDRTPGAGLGHVTRCDALASAWDRRGTATDWTVFDDYHSTIDDQRAARDAGQRVLVIDDHGTVGAYDADLILDQNLGAAATAYRGAHGRLLLGPRFVLLREQFRALAGHSAPSPRAGVALSGGGQPSAATASLLADLGGALPDARLLSGVDDVAAFLASAEVMVGAAGSTAYECCVVGTPMVLFAVADNQVPLGERLAAAGAAIYLGRLGEFDVAEALDAVRCADLPTMSERARAVADVDGADRVAVQMRAFDIELRPITPDDCRTIWEWSNSAAVRSESFDGATIEWDDHLRWFDRQLRDPERLHYVASVGGIAIGQIRFDCDGDEALLGFSVVDDARGQGWGAPVLVAGCRRLRADRPTAHVVGRVKPQNSASSRSFELAGFAG